MSEISSKSTLDEIVFANRNKEYGAYSLRKAYKGIATKATVLGTVIFAAIFLGPKLLDKFKTEEETQEYMVDVNLLELPPPPLDNNEPPPPPPPPVEQPKVATVKFLPPEVKKDEEVPQESPPPTVEDLKEAVVAKETVEGDPNATEIIIAPDAVIAAPSKGTVVEAAPVEEKIFTAVEQQPEFPGGAAEMYKYLSKNIKYPGAASRANVSGRVFLQFVVGTDGSITDIEVVKGIGFGCDDEAIRVVKGMPKWNPGKQSGRPVKVKYTLPVNFQLE